MFTMWGVALFPIGVSGISDLLRHVHFKMN